MKVSIEDIKNLREQTQLSIIECKKALQEADGDIKKAKEFLAKQGLISAEKKKERVTGEGLIESYVHSDGKIGVLLELSCETDFVAKNEEFVNLAHEITLQIASLDPKDVEELLDQSYIRDPSRTVKNLVTEVITKTGENIKLKRFVRFRVGE